MEYEDCMNSEFDLKLTYQYVLALRNSLNKNVNKACLPLTLRSETGVLHGGLLALAIFNSSSQILDRTN